MLIPDSCRHFIHLTPVLACGLHRKQNKELPTSGFILHHGLRMLNKELEKECHITCFAERSFNLHCLLTTAM